MARPYTPQATANREFENEIEEGKVDCQQAAEDVGTFTYAEEYRGELRRFERSGDFELRLEDARREIRHGSSPFSWFLDQAPEDPFAARILRVLEDDDEKSFLDQDEIWGTFCEEDYYLQDLVDLVDHCDD